MQAEVHVNNRQSCPKSLFYDLAFVAILGIFTSVHELQSPARMVTFVSYFLLLYWVWFSQVRRPSMSELQERNAHLAILHRGRPRTTSGRFSKSSI